MHIKSRTVNKLRKSIIKNSFCKIKDFPNSDYIRIIRTIHKLGKMEIWCVRGFGRAYLTPYPKGTDISFPIKEKQFDLEIINNKFKITNI